MKISLLRILMMCVACLVLVGLLVVTRLQPLHFQRTSLVPTDPRTPVERLGSESLIERQRAVTELLSVGTSWQDQLVAATKDSNAKRAANSLRVLYVRSHPLPRLRETLEALARECSSSWRLFSWAGTALLADLCNGKLWGDVAASLAQQGFRVSGGSKPADPPPENDAFHYYEIGMPSIHVPEGLMPVIRFTVSGQQPEQYATLIRSAHVGVVSLQSLVQAWPEATRKDASIAFLGRVLLREELADAWSEGWKLESMDIVAGQFARGLQGEVPPERSAAFYVKCTFTLPRPMKPPRYGYYEFVVESALGPLEEWRWRLDGFGPTPSDTVGDISGRGGVW